MSLKRKAAEVAGAGDAKKVKNANIASFFAAAPSTTPKAAATPVAKFDKEKWVEKLTDDQKELLQLEIDTLHESWLAHLKDEILRPEFLNLKRFLKKELEAKKTIFPPLEDVYSWY